MNDIQHNTTHLDRVRDFGGDRVARVRAENRKELRVVVRLDLFRVFLIKSS